MKLLFIVLVGIGTSLQSFAGVSLERSWARSTLSSGHIGFRHVHRMAPLLSETLVFQGNGTDGLSAYSRKTGHKQWERVFTNGVEGGAVLSGDALYFGAGDGYFYALNASDGKTIWKQSISSESLASPLVQGKLVFFLAGNNSLFAFDKSSGRPLWVKTRPLKATMTLRGVTQPTFYEGNVYVGYSDGGVSAYEANSGRQVWSRRIGDGRKFNDVDASARIHGQCLLVSSFENSLFCLNPKDGKTLWEHSAGAFQPATVWQNKVFLPTKDGEIHVLDLSSGKLLKKTILGKKGLSTELIFTKEYLMYGESQGGLVLRNPATMEVLSRFDTGRGLFARPTFDENTNEVYLLSNEGNLFELKVTPHKEDFPWRMKTRF